ncbi:hypothetical protein INR49_007643 [Caranx melampygus]|nr:hypothetical protein INR49_007643 [Caranx melampygus]
MQNLLDHGGQLPSAQAWLEFDFEIYRCDMQELDDAGVGSHVGAVTAEGDKCRDSKRAASVIRLVSAEVLHVPSVILGQIVI